jgi:hypothetical protein
MADENGSVETGNPASDTAAPAAQWFDSFSDVTKEVVTAKGWKGPEDAIASYHNLEQFMGADKAGRGVVIPKDDAPPEEQTAFWNRLGRPESADGYQLPVPDGDDGEFMKTASQWMHKANLTAAQAKIVADEWNAFWAQTQQDGEAAYQQTAAIEKANLQKAWGDKFDANSETARRAAREAGISDEDRAALERVWGFEKATRTLEVLGRAFLEAPLRDGSNVVNFGGTPEAAKARLATLHADAAWVTRFLNGDKAAQEESNRLHQIAYQ